MLIIRDKRLQLLILFTLFVSIFFWTQSRYPALQHKAHLAEINPTMVDSLVPVGAKKISEYGASYWDKVYNTTISWIHANKKGMSFGVVFAAALLTIFSYLPTFTSTNRFLNSLYGMASGVPLGICANCVAPVTKGLYESGISQQTALAMMFSSPTLNIIVITMTFSVFPIELAVLKTLTVLLLIMVLVPLIPNVQRKKQVEHNEISDDWQKVDPIDTQACSIQDIRKSENYGKAIAGAAKDYINNFIYIVIRTVPLMFIAGFLGAILVNSVNFNALAAGGISWYELIIISFISTFMPMPVAFDVILANSLYISGLPMAAVGALLFTLGAFSIYTFSIVAQTFSLKIAGLLYLLVMSLGIVMGVISHLIV